MKPTPAEVQAKILSIDPSNIKVVTTERPYRKELAPLVRTLFKELRIKGVSVTTPNYSIARSVAIGIPKPAVTDADYIGPNGMNYRECAFYSDIPDDVPIKVNLRKNRAVQDRLEAILLAAFPGCADRSDYQSDYFYYLFSFC